MVLFKNIQAWGRLAQEMSVQKGEDRVSRAGAWSWSSGILSLGLVCTSEFQGFLLSWQQALVWSPPPPSSSPAFSVFPPPLPLVSLHPLPQTSHARGEGAGRAGGTHSAGRLCLFWALAGEVGEKMGQHRAATWLGLEDRASVR